MYELAKTGIFNLLGSELSLIPRIRRLGRSSLVVIANLHRVNDHKRGDYAAMHPKVFSELVLFLKRHFEIVNFSTLSRGGREIALKKPRLILSFDDGYKDFIDIVVPILDRHGISANQNVIPECVESGQPPMNVALQDFLWTAPATLIREIRTPWLEWKLDPDNRIVSALRASAALKRRSHQEQIVIFEDLLPQMMRYDSFRTTPMMTRVEVRQVSVTHEIGAHSWSHANMAAESDGYLELDLRRCRDYFATCLDCAMRIYAFPNGSYREEQIDIARRAGVEHVLLVGDGYSYGRPGAHRRFNVYGSSLGELRFRATGGFHSPQIDK